MKTNIVRKLMTVMVSVIMLTACSSNDEPEKNLEGEKMVDHIESVLEGYLLDMYANKAMNLYMLPVENEGKAREVVKEIILENYDGKEKTYMVPGNMGHIRMIPEAEEGLHYTLVFDVVGLKKFTFQLCTPGYPESDNVPESTEHVKMTIGYFYCYDCHKETTIDKNHCCKVCGSDKVEYVGGGTFR